jgi:hypothetical protein
MFEKCLEHDRTGLGEVTLKMAQTLSRDQSVPYMQCGVVGLTNKYVSASPTDAALDELGGEIGNQIREWYPIQDEAITGGLRLLYKRTVGVSEVPWDSYSLLLALIGGALLERYDDSAGSLVVLDEFSRRTLE